MSFWAGAGSALVASAASAYGAHQANLAAGRVRQGTMDYNTWATEQSQNWNERMAQKRHQMAAADLRMAGLNPILSATSGMGSGMGMSSAASAPAPYEVKNVGASAAQDFLAARMQREQFKLMAEQTNAAAQQAFKAKQEGFEAATRQIGQSWQNRMLIDRYESGTYADQLKAERADARAGATAATLERELDESSGELFRTLRRLGVGGNTAAQILRGVAGGGSRTYNIQNRR